MRRPPERASMAATEAPAVALARRVGGRSRRRPRSQRWEGLGATAAARVGAEVELCAREAGVAGR